MSEQYYSVIERFRTLAEEIRSLFYTGNPIPVWLAIIIGGSILGFVGVGIFQFWRSTEPIVTEIRNMAPLIAVGFSLMIMFLAFMPFFMVFNIIMGIVR